MNLQTLFKPKTMAVIGVSTTNDRHPANVIYSKNHLRYPVEVFAVNPRGGMLQDDPIFTAISDIPKQIELAVIAARADYVPDILSDCIKSDVKAAIVVSGGFSEVGRLDLQDRMVAMAREAEFPFIGPNCLGIYVPNYIDSFFLPTERMVKPDEGNVAFISQSGGIL
ncbi:MAG: CoA-binding protein, partial [Deltaproteobacteria bacterium]|nr:CoA-binding protein [Deltaproteobacteria bacterium]